MSKFTKFVALYLTLLMSVFIPLKNAFACEGNFLKIENLELCLPTNTEIRLDITDTETKVLLINQEGGSLVMSIHERDKQYLFPTFEVELGNDIESQMMMQNKSSIFRSLEDATDQGNVSIEGVFLPLPKN